MRAIVRKNNCLETIGERPTKITDDKWNEMDDNAITKLHLAFLDRVQSNVAEENIVKGIWDTLTKLYKAKIFLKRKLYTL